MYPIRISALFPTLNINHLSYKINSKQGVGVEKDLSGEIIKNVFTKAVIS